MRAGLPRSAARLVLGICLAGGWLAGCAGPERQLLGVWRSAEDATCAIDQLTFTPDTITSRYGPGSAYAGQETTTRVFYVGAGGGQIRANSTDHAGSATYILTDSTHMRLDEPDGCTFVRVR